MLVLYFYIILIVSLIHTAHMNIPYLWYFTTFHNDILLYR